MAEDCAKMEEYQDAARAIVLKGLKDYSLSEDYKKLAQYDPDLARELVKTDLNFQIGAAPLFQIVKLNGIAWGERYHYSSYDHSKIRDAHIKRSFSTEPIVFLINSDEVSEETLTKALNVFDIKRSLVKRLTESTIRRISKEAGENALEEEFGGWSGVYTSCERCSDLSFESVQDENYLHVNPISIEFLRGAEKRTIVVGYLIAKDTVYFDVVSMGAAAEKAFQLFQRKKKKKKIALGVLVSLLFIVLFVTGYTIYYAFWGGGLEAMPIYQWFH